tara:strand:- start:444 stop:692 length:249 start_codon:yes stop_codon:yes gene_type:complete
MKINELTFNASEINEAYKKLCIRLGMLPEELGTGQMSRTMAYNTDFPNKKKLTKLARKLYGDPKKVQRKYAKIILGRAGGSS